MLAERMKKNRGAGRPLLALVGFIQTRAAPIGARKSNFPALEGNHDRPTATDRPDQKEVRAETACWNQLLRKYETCF